MRNGIITNSRPRNGPRPSSLVHRPRTEALVLSSGLKTDFVRLLIDRTNLRMRSVRISLKTRQPTITGMTPMETIGCHLSCDPPWQITTETRAATMLRCDPCYYHTTDPVRYQYPFRRFRGKAVLLPPRHQDTKKDWWSFVSSCLGGDFLAERWFCLDRNLTAEALGTRRLL